MRHMIPWFGSRWRVMVNALKIESTSGEAGLGEKEQ